MRDQSGRSASRRRRFARLRSTALPNFLPATKATRECSNPFARTLTMTSGWANARPCCHTRCTSDSAFSRHARFTRHLDKADALLGLAKDFGALDADGQTRAPLGAARPQHIAPAHRTHFPTKTVYAQTVQAFGLIRSFHVTTPDRRHNAALTISKCQKKRAAKFTTRAMRDYTRAPLNHKIRLAGFCVKTAPTISSRFSSSDRNPGVP